jgi:nucleoside-diphosphate-sugar epimerase
MRILLTGHKGYIGTVAVPLLLERGHDVVGLDSALFEECVLGTVEPRIPEIRKDLRDISKDDVAGFEAVVHLAALSNDPLGNLNPSLTYDVNYSASVRLAELAKQAGTERFVFSSSCSTYGAAGDNFLDEASELRPVTPYAESKVMMEQALAALADDRFSPTSLRNATAYGFSPRLRLDIVLNDFVASAYATGKICIKSDGTPWRPIVHIEDIIGAIAAVLEAPRESVHNEVFNVGQTSENYRVRDLAEIVANTVPCCSIEYAADGGPDKRCYRVDFDKIRRVLPSYCPRWNASAGAQQLYQAYKENGFNANDLASSRYLRLAHIKEMIDGGTLDPSLRRVLGPRQLQDEYAILRA